MDTEYLRDVLARLPAMANRDDLDALLTGRWQLPVITAS
ncbi:transposase domain-containing protein [Termitidicoccus mucosus]